eukprot:TRINITY_DN18963_c0_g1_i9.p1 TRINITY_DN18963_c0_g1~~TRINITY_DN18963_c0_g1_i9.p1  ORF type:complete len:223 (+),score=1.82 TRINITY_DN18963_c0_g1_i9:60-671(+)
MTGCANSVAYRWDLDNPPVTPDTSSSGTVEDSISLQTYEGHSGCIYSMQYDGKRLYTGSEDQTIKLWRVDSGLCQITMNGHTGFVWSLALAPSTMKNRLFSGSDDRSVKEWDLERGKWVLDMRGHTKSVRSVSFCDRRLVSGSCDNTVKEWDIRSGRCVRTYSGHYDGVYAVSLDEERLVSGSEDRKSGSAGMPRPTRMPSSA